MPKIVTKVPHLRYKSWKLVGATPEQHSDAIQRTAPPITLLRIFWPSFNLASRSSKNALCLLVDAGSDTNASASSSDSLLTEMGEKIRSIP